MGTERRSRCELVMALLRASDGGRRKTPMFRRANMNFEQGERYLETALEAGLLREESGEYSVTEKGARTLKHWRIIEDQLAEALGLGGGPRSRNKGL